MATIIDALMVTLGLDAAGLEKGYADAEKALDSFAERSNAAGRRVATSLGVSEKALKDWQNTAGNALKSSPVAKEFDALGVSATTAGGKVKPLQTILSDLASAMAGLDKARAETLGADLGLSTQTVDRLRNGKTAVDALVVSEQKLVDIERKQADASNKQSKEQQDRNKKQTESYAKLRNEILAFTAATITAVGGKALLERVTSNDASMGRLSGNVGMATEEISAWEKAVTNAGGTAADFDGTLRHIAGNVQSWKMTASSDMLQGLRLARVDAGKFLDETTPMKDRLLMLANAFKGMNAASAQYIGGQMGLSEGVVNELIKGPEAVQRDLAEQAKSGTSGPDADAAKTREQSWNNFSSAVDDIWRKLETELTPAFKDVLGAATDFIQKYPDIAKLAAVVASLGVSAMGAFGSLKLIAGVLGLMGKSAPAVAGAGAGVGAAEAGSAVGTGVAEGGAAAGSAITGAALATGVGVGLVVALAPNQSIDADEDKHLKDALKDPDNQAKMAPPSATPVGPSIFDVAPAHTAGAIATPVPMAPPASAAPTPAPAETPPVAAPSAVPTPQPALATPTETNGLPGKIDALITELHSDAVDIPKVLDRLQTMTDAVKALVEMIRDGTTKAVARVGAAAIAADSPVKGTPAAYSVPAAPTTGSQTDATTYAVQYFQAQGWTKEQAAGIAANLKAESGFNPNAQGDHGHAYGVGQWHRDRQQAFQQFTGKDIRGSTLDEQLAFYQHELTTGQDAIARRGGEMLRNASTAADAGAIVSKFVERPANRDREAATRGALAENIAKAVQGSNVPQSAAAAPTPSADRALTTWSPDYRALSRTNGDLDQQQTRGIEVIRGALVEIANIRAATSKVPPMALSNIDPSLMITPAALTAYRGYPTSNAQTTSNTNTSEVHIDNVTINTRATDAKGIASDFGAEVRRRAFAYQADTGLA